jgi:hypothetical protein
VGAAKHRACIAICAKLRASYFACGPQTRIGHIGNALPSLVGHFLSTPANGPACCSRSPRALIELIAQVFPQLRARFGSKKHPDPYAEAGTEEKREECRPFGTCHTTLLEKNKFSLSLMFLGQATCQEFWFVRLPG